MSLTHSLFIPCHDEIDIRWSKVSNQEKDELIIICADCVVYFCPGPSATHIPACTIFTGPCVCGDWCPDESNRIAVVSNNAIRIINIASKGDHIEECAVIKEFKEFITIEPPVGDNELKYIHWIDGNKILVGFDDDMICILNIDSGATADFYDDPCRSGRDDSKGPVTFFIHQWYLFA